MFIIVESLIVNLAIDIRTSIYSVMTVQNNYGLLFENREGQFFCSNTNNWCQNQYMGV